MSGSVRLASLALSAALVTASPAGAAESCKLLALGELPVSMDGLDPVVSGKIDGQPVRLIADSGAFFSTLNSNAAARLKLRSQYSGNGGFRVRGVNGEVEAGLKVADQFTVLNHTFKDTEFVTIPSSFGSRADGLLGQNFLNVWETEFDLANGAIRLFKAEGCQNAALAYWSKTTPYSVIPVDRTETGAHQIRGHVSVNGVELPAVFDTGAGPSVLTLRGAARAGIRRDDPALKPGGVSGGIARRLVQTWIAPVRSFKIGDEEIRNTRLRVGEIEVEGADMLIGADFFLSHRILVANSQRKLYLSYNGGPVFNLDVADDRLSTSSPSAAAGSPPPPAALQEGEPKDADGFVRRARAHAARREYAEAISDYTQAAGLTPKDPQLFLSRGRVRLARHQPDEALSDFDEALRLKPGDVEILITRGALHLRQKRLELAKADFDAAAAQDRRLLVNIGVLYTEAGLYSEAVGRFDDWLSGTAKGAEAASALNDRCWARGLWNRELDKALADCNAALALEPRNLNFLDSRGFVEIRLGRPKDAIRDYDAILREQPKSAWPLYSRGVAKQKAGMTAAGENDMKAAMGIDPEVAVQAKRYGLAGQAQEGARP